MLEFIKDSSLVLIRIVTILPLVLFTTLYMGKRTIGEVPIFDFLVIITLGSVVGADIADPNIKHLPTAIAIIGIGILQKVISNLKISNRKIGRLITFEPTIVVQNGKFLDENLKKIRYSIDNILQMLREKGIFDITDVETAIIEASGNISVLKKPKKNSVTLEDMKIPKKTSSITFPVIIEGKPSLDVLNYFKLDETWLNDKLAYHEINDINTIFFASINHKHELQISLKDENGAILPIINH